MDGMRDGRQSMAPGRPMSPANQGMPPSPGSNCYVRGVGEMYMNYPGQTYAPPYLPSDYNFHPERPSPNLANLPGEHLFDVTKLPIRTDIPPPPLGCPPFDLNTAAATRQMFDAFARNDLMTMYNNPYAFQRSCSFGDWVSMQQMYNSYMEFLNYIGDSRSPSPSQPSTKTQSVQTQTPILEFKSTMIQTEFAETSDSHKFSASQPVEEARTEPEDTPQGQKTQAVSVLPPDTGSLGFSPQLPEPKCRISVADKAKPEVKNASNDTHNDENNKNPNINLAATESQGNNGAFLDKDDLLMPVPRSRGRGRTKHDIDDKQSESPPIPGGLVTKNAQNPENGFSNPKKDAPASEEAPKANAEKCSTTGRTRGRGQPPGLKLLIPGNATSKNHENVNSNSRQNEAKSSPSIAMVNTSPNFTPTAVHSPSVSVPPGFKRKPTSPPVDFDMNIPLSPLHLIPLGNGFGVAVGGPSFEPNHAPRPLDSPSVPRPPVSAPPGFNVNRNKPANGQNDLNNPHAQQRIRLDLVKQQNKEKINLPVFTKMFIQRYLRASLTDNRRRKGKKVPPPLTIMEKIEEKSEEESVVGDDRQVDSQASPRYVEGKIDDDDKQQNDATIAKQVPYDNDQRARYGRPIQGAGNQSNADTRQIDSQNQRPGKQINFGYGNKIPENLRSQIQNCDQRSRDANYHTSLTQSSRTPLSTPLTPAYSPSKIAVHSPDGSKNCRRSPLPSTNRSAALKNPDIIHNGVSQENTENWENVDTDVYVPCKWYNKQLKPIFEVTGKNPEDYAQLH